MNIYRGKTHTEVYLASVLYDAIEDQDFSSATTLLTIKNADPNIVLPRKGISPFHLAIGSDSANFALKVTALIIQHGGDPNVRSDEGLTPVHIAAAWGRTEILQLLLTCGGDPEITDNCYKSALHYAVDEEYEDAVEIITNFVDHQRFSVLSEFLTKVPCNISLDKIIINNGGIIGQYEVAKDEKPSIVTEDLKKLPQTSGNEYVLNWCNSQNLNGDLPLFEFNDSVNNAFCLSHNSSLSSQKSNKIRRNLDNVNCRPRLHRTNNADKIDFISKDICHYKESSRESGIATLSESFPESNKNIDDYLGYALLKTDSDESVGVHSDVKYNHTEVKDNAPLSGKSKDTSSDYFTCTDGSDGANILEQNIYEVSSSGSSISPKTRSDDQDVPSISISEIYRYTDAEEGVVLFERRLLVPSVASSQNESVRTSLTQSSNLSSLPKSFDYDTDSLRKELTNQGYVPGPITKTTKRVYLRKLYHLKKNPEIVAAEPAFKRVYSNELEQTLKEPNWAFDLSAHNKLEATLAKEFANPDPARRWREGLNKSCFTYLLLDPRVTRNLPCRADNLPPSEVWEVFLSSIFYVGKGKRSRPYSHLYDAVSHYGKGDDFATSNVKLKCILDIWLHNQGVICLHVFQNVIPVEAYTREAAMIAALKVENITNLKKGNFYGVAATWTQHQKNLLGVLLLHRAMKIFLIEGERQLSPQDID